MNPWNRRDRGCRQGATATLECGPPEQIRVESPASGRWGGVEEREREREKVREKERRGCRVEPGAGGDRINKSVRKDVDRRRVAGKNYTFRVA